MQYILKLIDPNRGLCLITLESSEISKKIEVDFFSQTYFCCHILSNKDAGVVGKV